MREAQAGANNIFKEHQQSFDAAEKTGKIETVFR
jgi:hypothetical protein